MNDLLKVLIVEDEIILAMMVASTLSRLGCFVCGKATSGEDALRLYDENHPDIVLFDIQLRTKMSGIEAARKLQESYPLAKFAFMTAFGTDDIVAEALSLAPVGLLQKPVNEENLRQIINTFNN